MPTYDYRCRACGHEFELFQSMSEGVKRKCPECERLQLERLIGSGAGILFRGSGFYETDYRSKSYKEAAAKEKDGSKSSSQDSKGKDSKGKLRTENTKVGAICCLSARHYTSQGLEPVRAGAAATWCSRTLSVSRRSTSAARSWPRRSARGGCFPRWKSMSPLRTRTPAALPTMPTS